MIKKILCLVSSFLITTPVVLLTQVSCANNKNNSFSNTELLSVPSSKTNTIDVYASEISNEFNNNPSILNQYLNNLQFSNKPKDAKIIFSNLVSNDVLGTLSFDVSLDKSYSNGSLLNSPKVFGNFTIKNFKKKNLDSIKSTNLKAAPRSSSAATSILPSDLSTSNLTSYILNINSSDILNLPSDAIVSYKINSFSNKFGSVNFSVVVNKYYDEDGNLINKSKTLVTATIYDFKTLQNVKKTSVLINPPTVKNFNISVSSIKKDLEQNPNNIIKYINPPKFFDQPTNSNIIYKNFKYYEDNGIFAFDCGLSSYYDENGNLVNNEKIFNTYSFSNFLVNIQNETNIDNYLDSALSIPLASTLLPSEVVNINNSSIKDGYILLNTNIANFSLTSYDLLSFDDTQGTLSLKMNYKYNNQSKSKTFNFNKFKKFNQPNNISVKVVNTGANTLSAYDLCEKNNNKLTDNYIKTILKDNGIFIDLFSNGFKLSPENYSFSDVKLEGFDESWFSNNTNINISATVQNLSFFTYLKKENNNIVSNKTQYNYNIKFNISMISATNYFLVNSKVNNGLIKNNFNMPIEYYYADLKYSPNGLLRSNESLINSLSYQKEFTYKNKTYKFTPYIDEICNYQISGSNSSMDLYVKIKLSTNDDLIVTSSDSKKISVSNLDSIPFNNTTGFYVRQDENKFNSNLNDFLLKKPYRDRIYKLINNINNTKNDIFIDLPSNLLEKRFELGMIFTYKNEDLINENGFYQTKNFTSSGNGIAIDWIRCDNYRLYYDRNLDNFYLKVDINVQTCNQIFKSNDINVYITYKGSWNKATK